MTRRVAYSPQAQRHLTDLYDWIAHESGFPDRAEAYVTVLMDRCDALADFPRLVALATTSALACAPSGFADVLSSLSPSSMR